MRQGNAGVSTGKTPESLFKLEGNYLKLHIDSAVVRTELKVEKISEKLENWFTQPFENFVSEVKKQKGGFKDLKIGRAHV